jgi:hypothetical protein
MPYILNLYTGDGSESRLAAQGLLNHPEQMTRILEHYRFLIMLLGY